MRGSASFQRTTTAEDGDLALALSLEEAEGQRGTAAEPRIAHTDNWATLQSDGEICEHTRRYWCTAYRHDRAYEK